MRRAVYVILLTGLSMIGLGCAPLLIGAGAVGGYAISNDSIKNTLDQSKSYVYRVSRQVAGQMGVVTTEDQSGGVIKTLVQGVRVTITVKAVTEKGVELTVRARNEFWLPRTDVAQAVYNQIITRL